MTTNSAWTSLSATFVDAENVPKTFSSSLLPYAWSLLSHFLDTQAIFCCFSSLHRPLSTTLVLAPKSITIFTAHSQSPPLFQAVTSILQWTHTHLPHHCLLPTCISPSPSLLASYRFWFGCLGSVLRSQLISITTCLAGFPFAGHSGSLPKCPIWPHLWHVCFVFSRLLLPFTVMLAFTWVPNLIHISSFTHRTLQLSLHGFIRFCCFKKNM